MKLVLQEPQITDEKPMKLYCDNKAAINSSHNPVHHDQKKHVQVYRHFIKEKLEEEIICLIFVPTIEQVFDLFTKSLGRLTFEKLTNKLDLINVCHPVEGEY